MILAELRGLYSLANNEDAINVMAIISRAKKVEESYHLRGENHYFYAKETTALRLSIHNFEPMDEDVAQEIIKTERAIIDAKNAA